MRTKSALIVVLSLCLLVIGCFRPEAASGDENRMNPAITKLRQLGFDLSDSVLESIEDELCADPDTLTITDLLLGLGLGDYDYDTGEWTPRSRCVYAFDAEIFDVERMYTLFLQGIQSIVPELQITDIHEDLSGMTDELIGAGNSMSPDTDGKRSVSFVCNGHAYSTELVSYGDWFNEEMFSFMEQVLEKENCPLKLYWFSAHIQFCIVVYGTEELAAELQPLVEPY